VNHNSLLLLNRLLTLLALIACWRRIFFVMIMRMISTARFFFKVVFHYYRNVFTTHPTIHDAK